MCVIVGVQRRGRKQKHTFIIDLLRKLLCILDIFAELEI